MPQVIISLAGIAADREPITQLLTRVFAESGAACAVCDDADADLILAYDASLPTDAYAISRAGKALCIAGANLPGLVAGIGRHVHEALSPDGYRPDAWLGKSVPECLFRGMYFAHNFKNWYRSAPLADIKRYIEDLALWGLSHIAFPLGTNPVSPTAEIEQEMIPRQVELMRFAQTIGVRVGFIAIANGILDVPGPDIAATPVPDADPPKRGNVGNRVCPSNPAGMEAIRRHFLNVFDRFGDVAIDFVTAFPYDEGGCACPDCWPWGARGYVTVCKEISRIAKARHPRCAMIAGTWCFDALGDQEGEYDGIDRAIREEPGWCDVIMCDDHGHFPAWPRRHGSPGGLPMINFSEISMWGRWPWGGWGANPFPERMVGIWNESQSLLSGGLPYSEGRFEDINKVTCLRLFWDRTATARDIVTRYAAHYFSRTQAGKIADAVALLEETYPAPGATMDAAVLRAHALLSEVDAALPETARRSWRWRILLLRSLIDAESARHGWAKIPVSDAQKAAFAELVTLYCAQNAQSCLRLAGQ